MSSSKKPKSSRKSAFVTPQEDFWAGEFGNEYTVRNQGERIVASNAALFSKVLARTGKIGSAIELGANIGLNLQALRLLDPAIQIAAVEINASAVKALKKIGKIETHHSSIMDFRPRKTFELSFVKGVLIHINPDELKNVYAALYNSSNRFVMIAEYYNPSPVTIPYRGHTDRLFKRDFAGEMLDKYRDLKLVDYGFVYRRDPNFPQDDLTWFLLEKAEGMMRAAGMVKSLKEIRESYDRQAGTYIAAMDNPDYADMKQKSGKKLAGILDDLQPETLLDAGTGEATTLVATLSVMKQLPIRTIGFDISLPRLFLARDYLNKNRLDANLLMASLNQIPFGDAAVDVVTTYHAIEPNRGREREIVLELLRVAGEYLVMVEPSYELADENSKARMDRLGYVRNLPGILEQEGFKFTVMPWGMDVRPENPAAVIVVEKRK